MSSETLSIPKKISRRFEMIRIPYLNLETGRVEYIDKMVYKNRIPIRVSEAEKFTQLSPKTLKRMMRRGELTPCEANGSERKKKKVGNYPLFFDLKEFDELDL